MTEKSTFAEWVILELMGHRRLAGWLTEQEIGGQAFLRLDVFTGAPSQKLDEAEREEPAATQFYSASAVYCITPTTEDLARRVAQGADPAPVKRWELPAPPRERDDLGDQVVDDADDLDDERNWPGA